MNLWAQISVKIDVKFIEISAKNNIKKYFAFSKNDYK